MRLEWKGSELNLHLTEDEKQVMEHLIRTRGEGVVEQEISFWFSSRVDTIREELKRDIVQIVLPDTSIKALKEKLEELKK